VGKRGKDAGTLEGREAKELLRGAVNHLLEK
jgi:hypothetical protein